MTAFLGQFRIVNAGWLGRRDVFVDFVTNHVDQLFQLYSGRDLIGTTRLPTDRRLHGQLQPSDTPVPLTVLMVALSDRLTDFGPQLPSWPWNRYELDWSASGFPSDTDHFEVTAGTAPGGAVDSNNIVGRVPFRGDGAYTWRLPALSAGGTWNFEVTSRDDAQPLGNAGTAAAIAVAALVPPPDVQFDESGNRFTLSVTGGMATASFVF